MEAIADFILFASLAAFIVGVVNVIRPQAWMKVRKRLVGAFMVLGSLGGCVAGGMMLPPTTTSTAPAAEAAKPARPTVQATPKVDGVTQSEFDTLWAGVKNHMERCDAPLRRAGEAIGRGDVYLAFAPVKAAGDACRAAWLDTGKLEIPRSAKGDVKKALTEARSTCDTASYTKMQAMQQMAKVLDGDARPSAMASLSETVDRGKVLSTGCMLAFMGAAEKAGLTLPEFRELAAEAEKKATR